MGVERRRDLYLLLCVAVFVEFLLPKRQWEFSDAAKFAAAKSRYCCDGIVEADATWVRAYTTSRRHKQAPHPRPSFGSALEDSRRSQGKANCSKNGQMVSGTRRLSVA